MADGTQSTKYEMGIERRSYSNLGEGNLSAHICSTGLHLASLGIDSCHYGCGNDGVEGAVQVTFWITGQKEY